MVILMMEIVETADGIVTNRRDSWWLSIVKIASGRC